jgi:hexosaminidase
VLLLPTPTAVEPLPGLHTVHTPRTFRGIDLFSIAPRLAHTLRLAPCPPDSSPWLLCSLTGGSTPQDQSYTITITPDAPIRIDAASPAAIRYALATLSQLLRAHPHALPCTRIHDRPAFATRGIMLDLSRDRVPTMRHLYDTIDLLADLKFNHLQFYTEHTFAYAGHERVWTGWSPITPDQARTLSAYAAVQGIDLAANQNCFGHMVPWLRHPEYAHLAETHGDWMFDIWPRSGPFSLCPTDPASLDLVRDLLSQLLPCYGSPWVNIGCDETFDVGFGRSADAVAQRGRGTVYLEFVAKVARIVLDAGKRPQFWGDIALSHPECIPQIPADLTALAWGYEPDSPFTQWGKMLTSTNNPRDFWVCPGTSTWRAITGRTTERRGNLTAAATAGLTYGASGFLACDWGDSGHHQQWPIVMHALADAAQAAWNPASPRDNAAASLHLFGEPTGALSRWLDALGDADLPLRETCGALSHPTRTRLLNQTALFIDLFKRTDEQTHVGAPDHWADTLARLTSLSSSRPSAASSLINDELAYPAAYATAAARRGLARRTGNLPLLRDARDSLAAVAREHPRLWLTRSRTGGLADSLGYFSRLLAADARHAPNAPGTTLFE